MSVTFDDIRAHMADNDAKSNQMIEKALKTLPLRVLLSMTPKEMATFISEFYHEMREVYLRATR